MEEAVVVIVKHLQGRVAAAAGMTAADLRQTDAQAVAGVDHSVSEVDDVIVIAVASKLLDQSSDYWKYGWKLALRNDRTKKVVVDACIRYLDSDGFAVEEDHQYGLQILAQSIRTFTGTALIDASVAHGIETASARVTKS